MKYIVLGLILILTVIGPPARSADPSITYDGVASFDNQDANGVETLVSVHLQERRGAAVLALSINRYQDSCGPRTACSVGPLFAGSATQRIADGDASVSRQLAWASVHTRLSVHDAIANGNEEIAIDMQWCAIGAIDTYIPTPQNGTLVPAPQVIGEVFSRDATASGVVTGPSLDTVSLASMSPGTLSRHLGD